MRLLRRIQTQTPLLLLSFIITALFSGCGSIQIPVDIHDETLWTIKGNPSLPSSFENYAVQVQFLTTGQIDITKNQWDAISQGKVCMNLSAFDDFNTEISKLCSQVVCDYETVQAFSNLYARLKSVSLR